MYAGRLSEWLAAESYYRFTVACDVYVPIFHLNLGTSSIHYIVTTNGNSQKVGRI